MQRAAQTDQTSKPDFSDTEVVDAIATLSGALLEVMIYNVEVHDIFFFIWMIFTFP